MQIEHYTIQFKKIIAKAIYSIQIKLYTIQFKMFTTKMEKIKYCKVDMP